MTVIILYLLYTLYEADYILRQEQDFYQLLSVPLDADEKKIKSRFRRLWVLHLPSGDIQSNLDRRAALYHPDKLNTDDAARLAAAEKHFVSLKQAQDTLTDPIKRFAYERFGADMLTWQHCATMRDYLSRGLQVVQGPIYGASAMAMILLSFTSYLQGGRYWRYLFFGTLVVLEMHTITRPYHTPILEKVINPVLENLSWRPPLLPFQMLTLARKATFTLFIAFSQLSGLVQKPTSSQPNGNGGMNDLQQLSRLEQIAKQNEADAGRLLALDMAPFAGDEQGANELKGRMREWLVNNTIRADPEVRDAMGRALGKRRVGAPHGARISS